MEDETPKQEEKIMPRLVELAERIEKANAEAKNLLARQEELAARNLLGGHTDAGIQPPPVKEETPAEYRKRIMSGRI